MSFVSGLNSRLKCVLFVNNSVIYEQFVSLCYLFTNNFENRQILLSKIEEYFFLYKKRFRSAMYEKETVIDKDNIEIDLGRLNMNQDENESESETELDFMND